MAGGAFNMLGGRFFRMLRMARLLLAQEALLPPNFAQNAPLRVRLVRRILIIGAPRFQDNQQRQHSLSARIGKLGPLYIKIGQFLATRADIVGPIMAADLRQLQDRLPPFSQKTLTHILKSELEHSENYLANISPALAAASIAQVHQAHRPDAPAQKLAVKVLRPNIEKQIAVELRGFARMAWLVEKLVPSSRRLRPIAAIETLHRTLTAETDLRLEAAALSEMAENCKNDAHFAVPNVVWEASSKRVLTMQWIDGVAISDIAALRTKQHDLSALAVRLIRIFLTQALRDGFFHADMHQGNLLVRDDGTLVAIDLGIIGRLDGDSRRFLAEILHGFITRDYMKVARVHVQAGYVPAHHNVGEFAQALRAIGEPIRDQNAENISMAHLLTQLFEVTGQFDMHTQPQLLLLQKTMVTVEGVARSLDPQLNIWDAAEPVVSDWMHQSLGPQALVRDIADNAGDAVRAFIHFPETLAQLQAGAQNIEKIADYIAKPRRKTALWLGGLALVLALAAIALNFLR